MIAQSNEYLTEASNSIFRMNADDMMRKRCLDREEYYRDIRTWKKQIAEQAAALAEKDIALAKQANALVEKDIALTEKDAALAEKITALTEKDNIIADLKAQLAAFSQTEVPSQNIL